jgi:dolichol-phosphate mannosyltransferase
MAEKTLIFIPTFNERDNAARMVEEVLGLGLDADLLFIDDNSPDGTGAVLDELAGRHPRLKVIHRSGKLGIGSAHLAGIAHAYAECYTRLVTMDCDFTHSPSLIPEFLAAAGRSHVIVGSRYVSRHSLPHWSLFRKVLTRSGHFLTRWVLGIPQDATSAFRFYDLARIPRATFDRVRSQGYAFFFESLVVLTKNGFTIHEMPATLLARRRGESKMNVGEVARSVRTLLSLFVADKMNPARFRVDPGATVDSKRSSR